MLMKLTPGLYPEKKIKWGFQSFLNLVLKMSKSLSNSFAIRYFN
jgi:hypothetical protein